MRHRNDLVEMASQHVQHMQKALTQMNVQFQHVISDITGLTGLAILDAIIAGERDPVKLAKLRDPWIKASEETIRKSLEGNWRAEHILALKQRLSLYRSYRDQIDDCDKEIEKLVAAFEAKVDPAQKPMPEDRKRRQRQRKKKSGSPDFDMRTEAYKLFGVDLTQIPGLMTLVFMLFSEVGRDMSRWPTAAVARRSPDQEPRRYTLPIGGAFPISRPDPGRGQSPTDDSQTQSHRRYDRDGAQDRHHLLHDG